jgi:hypothetical protein
MEAISKIKLPELAQPSSEAVSLAPTSPPQVSASSASSLMVMMAQAQARYPNQTLPPETPEMYLIEWAEIVVKYGLVPFRDALSTAMRESDFFPSPNVIREWCESIAASRRNESSAERYIREQDEWKAQWEREREEDRLLRQLPAGVVSGGLDDPAVHRG